MAVNLKLGVELGDFQQNINTAKAQIKEFDAALKQAESRFKATGDAESAMATKTSQLTAKLQAQKRMVEEYRAALQKADENGVSKLNSEYIKLQTQMLNAEAAMYDTQTALNSLTVSEQEAAQGADALTKSVNGIGKKISLDQVISGINTITGGLENAARRAVDLGEKLWSMIMDSAQRADDQATTAQMYNIPLQRYKQMLALEKNGLDTTTDAILSSQKKLSSNIGKGSTATLDTLRELGLLFKTGKDAETFITTDTVEMFWEAGRAMMALGESFDKEAAAQSLFGKSWNELVPLFTQYKSLDEYEKALSEVNITSEETTEDLAALSDKVGDLQNTWTTLKDEIIGAVAPGLTGAADALNNVLGTVLKYLETDDGKAMLKQLGESVSTLFEDLSKINAEEVVNNFTTVFTGLIDNLKWIVDNKDTLVKALEGVVIGWGALKLTGGALEILKLINGLKDLLGISGAAGAASSGASTGIGIGAKLLATGGGVALTGAAATLSGALMPYAGPLAAAPMAIEDQTMFFRTLRNGGTVEEAIKAEGDAVAQAAENAGQAWLDWFDDIINVPKKLAKSVWKDLFGEGGGGGGGRSFDEPVEFEVEWDIPDDAAESISKGIGVVPVQISPVLTAASGIGAGAGGLGLGALWRDGGGGGHGFANGIPWVPDTMLAWLHPGERVLTARENRSYTANSNLYIENMNMGGGMDARALADAMSAQNRRISAGFGS